MIDACELRFTNDRLKYKDIVISRIKWGGLAQRSPQEQGTHALQLMERALKLAEEQRRGIVTVFAREVENGRGEVVGLNVLQIHSDNPGEMLRLKNEAQVLRDRLDSYKRRSTPISTVPTHLDELARLR